MADGKTIAGITPATETLVNAAPAANAASATDATEKTEGLIKITDAEIELQAEVGRIVVTLEQLGKLTAGQVVEFATMVESPVTLLAGGQAVARGELIDVGGRVGVRITTLADK